MYQFDYDNSITDFINSNHFAMLKIDPTNSSKNPQKLNK